jgi:nitrogen regulatory protein PII
MTFKYVIAIIRPDVLATLETKLGSLHIRGLTVTQVKGFGEYTDFYSQNHLTAHLKVEIFVEESKVEELTRAIMDVARSDIPGAGILAVLPVDQFFHIRTQT